MDSDYLMAAVWLQLLQVLSASKELEMLYLTSALAKHAAHNRSSGHSANAQRITAQVPAKPPISKPICRASSRVSRTSGLTVT